MKTKRLLVESLLSLFLTLLLLVATIFAWYSLRPAAEIEEFVATIGDYEVNVTLKVNKNGGDFVEVTTKEEMEEFFLNAVPDDDFTFQLEIINLSDFKIKLDLWLMNLNSETDDPDFSMLDVFFLEEGRVYINQDEIKVFDGDEEETLIHNELVHPYRFSYLLGDKSSLLLVDGLELEIEEKTLIEFTIGYYWRTENISYQEGVFNIGSLQINF